MTDVPASTQLGRKGPQHLNDSMQSKRLPRLSGSVSNEGENDSVWLALLSWVQSPSFTHSGR